MPTIELFSKKQKRLRGEVPDILKYDEIPAPLRVQAVYIIRDTFGKDYFNKKSVVTLSYKHIHAILCREYGVLALNTDISGSTYQQNLFNHIIKSNEKDVILDAIQLLFQYIVNEIKLQGDSYKSYADEVLMTPDEAVNELNLRFKEHSVGYQFESNELIRVDSTFIHSEIVKPTLSLLNNEKFVGANDEYLAAHEHYKNSRNKECLVDCLKSFESTMKIICKEKGWIFNENDPAKKLIQVLFNNDFVPSFTQNQFTSLHNLLESGIPTIRNKTSGHGQGQTPQQVSDEITRYGLNLTGANIIFLIEQSGIK